MFAAVPRMGGCDGPFLNPARDLSVESWSANTTRRRFCPQGNSTACCRCTRLPDPGPPARPEAARGYGFVGATAGAVFTGALAVPATASTAPPGHVTIASPNGRLRMTARVTDGRLRYQVVRHGRVLVPSSGLGPDLADRPSLTGGLVLESVRRRTMDERWRPVWGARRARPRPCTGVRTADRATGDRATAGPDRPGLRRRRRLPLPPAGPSRARPLHRDRREDRVLLATDRHELVAGRGHGLDR